MITGVCMGCCRFRAWRSKNINDSSNGASKHIILLYSNALLWTVFSRHDYYGWDCEALGSLIPSHSAPRSRIQHDIWRITMTPTTRQNYDYSECWRLSDHIYTYARNTSIKQEVRPSEWWLNLFWKPIVTPWSVERFQNEAAAPQLIAENTMISLSKVIYPLIRSAGPTSLWSSEYME